MLIVDAYTHCGLTRYEPVEKVRAVMTAAGVGRAVLVQHLGEYDSRYITQFAVAEPQLFVAVGLLDVTDPHWLTQLERLARDGGCTGIRVTTEMLRTAPDLLQAIADCAMTTVVWAPNGLAEDVQLLESQLEALPQARVVITHLGTPRMIGPEVIKANQAVLRLSAYEQVMIQLSGMGMFTPYPFQPLYEWIGAVAECFGKDRLMWGSNYPVVGGLEEYLADLLLLKEGRLPIPQAWIPSVIGGNTGRFWFGEINLA
jgi:predicted TIM-barrel fold metal-dependent hydrolase